MLSACKVRALQRSNAFYVIVAIGCLKKRTVCKGCYVFLSLASKTNVGTSQIKIFNDAWQRCSYSFCPQGPPESREIKVVVFL